jgi:hypothetical protein
LEWHRRLLRALSPPKAIEDIFAFAFYAWSAEEGGEEVSQRLGREPELLDSGENFQKSFKNEVCSDSVYLNFKCTEKLIGNVSEALFH